MMSSYVSVGGVKDRCGKYKLSAWGEEKETYEHGEAVVGEDHGHAGEESNGSVSFENPPLPGNDEGTHRLKNSGPYQSQAIAASTSVWISGRR